MISKVEDSRGWPIDYDKEICGGPVCSGQGCQSCDYKGDWVPHNKVTQEVMND